MIRSLAFALSAVLFLGCQWGCGSKPDASTLTHPKRNYAFPMYITVAGDTAGDGGDLLDSLITSRS